MLRNRRLAAGILAVLFAVALIFSAVFLAAESNHHCPGEECQICQQIAACIHTLQLLALALLVFHALTRGQSAFKSDDHASAETARGGTLVTQKIKLSC